MFFKPYSIRISLTKFRIYSVMLIVMLESGNAVEEEVEKLLPNKYSIKFKYVYLLIFRP